MNKLGALLIALQIALTLAIVTNANFIIQQRSADIERPTGLDEANTGLVVTTIFDMKVDQMQMLRDDLEALRAARDIVEASLNIAADICIYTNSNLTIETLEY